MVSDDDDSKMKYIYGCEYEGGRLCHDLTKMEYEVVELNIAAEESAPVPSGPMYAQNVPNSNDKMSDATPRRRWLFAQEREFRHEVAWA